MESESVLISNDDDHVIITWFKKQLAKITLGRFLAGFSLVLTLIAWNRGIALLYGLVALLVAILVVAWVFPRLNLIGVSAKRHLPATAVEGRSVEIGLQLSNTGWFGRYLIEVWDNLPFTGNLGKQLVSFIPALSKQNSVSISVQCELRGLHSIGPMTLKTGFPLGINQRSIEITDSRQSILVYPQPLHVNHLDLGVLQNNPCTQTQRVNNKKGHEEFAGVREYRHGDSIRHIHWPLSAKRNELIVKEHHPVSSNRIIVLLDLESGTNIGYGKHSTLEYAVKIAASIGDYALRHGIPFDLAGSHETLLSPQAYTHVSQRKTLLETLAYVQSNGNLSYFQLIQHVVFNQRQSGTVFLFDNGSSDLSACLNLLLSRRYQPIVYRFDTRSFELQKFHSSFVKSKDHEKTLYTIQCGSDLKRLFA